MSFFFVEAVVAGFDDFFAESGLASEAFSITGEDLVALPPPSFASLAFSLSSAPTF
jgi:hypothetical protein